MFGGGLDMFTAMNLMMSEMESRSTELDNPPTALGRINKFNPVCTDKAYRVFASCDGFIVRKDVVEEQCDVRMKEIGELDGDWYCYNIDYKDTPCLVVAELARLYGGTALSLYNPMCTADETWHRILGDLSKYQSTYYERNKDWLVGYF